MDPHDDSADEIRVDRDRGRLYITLRGRLDADEIEMAADMAVEGAQSLSPPFDSTNDISGFRPPGPDAAAPIEEAQAVLAEMDIDRVVRIADGDSRTVVVTAFERRSQNVGYEGLTADSVEAAERMLECCATRSGDYLTLKLVHAAMPTVTVETDRRCEVLDI